MKQLWIGGANVYWNDEPKITIMTKTDTCINLNIIVLKCSIIYTYMYMYKI